MKTSGRVLKQAAAQLAADADDFEIVPEHLEIAAHREFFEREPHVHAGGFHARTADADDVERGQVLAQGEDQLAAEQVARRFARDDCNGARASRRLSG